MSTPTAKYIALLTCRLASQYYAFRVSAVEEVAAMVATTQLTDAAPALIGMANRHGEAMPLIDLRMAFGLSQTPIDVRTLFIVVRDGEHLVGLVVDEVFQVQYVDEAQLQATNSSSGSVTHIVSVDDRIYQIIDISALLERYLV